MEDLTQGGSPGALTLWWTWGCQVPASALQDLWTLAQRWFSGSPTDHCQVKFLVNRHREAPLNWPSKYLRLKIGLGLFKSKNKGLWKPALNPPDSSFSKYDIQVFSWWGFPGGTSGKGPNACQCRRHKRYKFDSWMGKIPWRRKWQPSPVFLPGESYGYRSLAGCSPRIAKSWTWLSYLACTQLVDMAISQRAKCSCLTYYITWGKWLYIVSVVQSLGLFETPWTAARQASLSFTSSQSLLKLMSIESMIPYDHLILCRPYGWSQKWRQSPRYWLSGAQQSIQMVWVSHWGCAVGTWPHAQSLTVGIPQPASCCSLMNKKSILCIEIRYVSNQNSRKAVVWVQNMSSLRVKKNDRRLCTDARLGV